MDRQYAVAALLGRRVSAADGAVEYRVRWEGYGPAADTWEPRPALLAGGCEALVTACDLREMGGTDARLAAWRRARGRKRGRAEAAAAEGPEMLSGVLLRPRGEAPALVLLGELTATEEVAAALSSAEPRRRKGQRQAGAEAARLCGPALALERAWRGTLGATAGHSVAAATAATPLARNFGGARGGGGRVEVLSIGPPGAAAGRPFAAPESPVPLVGEAEAERLRREAGAHGAAAAAAAHDQLRPRREGLVAQLRHTYAVSAGGAAPETRSELCWLPVSVLREAYPQELLDFLLASALVLECPDGPRTGAWAAGSSAKGVSHH